MLPDGCRYEPAGRRRSAAALVPLLEIWSTTVAREDPDGDRTTSDERSERGSERRSDEDRDDGPNWSKAGVVGALGLELAGFLLVGVLGGNYLDEKLGTSPLLMILGLFAALAAAGLQLWQFIRRFGSSDDDDE